MKKKSINFLNLYLLYRFLPLIFFLNPVLISILSLLLYLFLFFLFFLNHICPRSISTQYSIAVYKFSFTTTMHLCRSNSRNNNLKYKISLFSILLLLLIGTKL